MKAVVLAGGKGTRFHPYTFVIPKPLMPIGENPILLHLIHAFRKSGIREFLLSTGYQAELIRAYFCNGEKFGAQIKYFYGEKPLETAGPLSMMREEFTDDELFFVINGDIYTEPRLGKMADFARRQASDIVVGYVDRIEKSKFGVMTIENDRVRRIVEKPEQKFSISAGIYVMRGRCENVNGVVQAPPRNQI
jgi:NDP-sugar pyrophosphorylase family protein